ncbi:DUF2501 domain-containing protein [Xenophilus azovorans]|uniref:DUF2501 domain-containing protein n=1 Tax=Xenophilus azovorans TaxID=151755 RepID=UPI00056E47BF|nr:DUF2501 domain-containing protein [Xenophilus azovorans]
MHRSLPAAALCAALLAAGGAAHANKYLDAMKEQLGSSGQADAGSASGGGAAALASGLGLSMPAMGNSTLGNAAGVIQYCVKNNYLSAASANSVKDRLLGMVTGQKPQQTGFANGAKGLLQGENGKSLNMKNLSSKLKEKACDYVLKNATSLL